MKSNKSKKERTLGKRFINPLEENLATDSNEIPGYILTGDYVPTGGYVASGENKWTGYYVSTGGCVPTGDFDLIGYYVPTGDFEQTGGTGGFVPTGDYEFSGRFVQNGDYAPTRRKKPAKAAIPVFRVKGYPKRLSSPKGYYIPSIISL
ncbi:hypothetical protein [Fictibacillus barbaricus]|uniref:Uncharacterized protein n=1 Tax=Fictibacillus barbaricus TaxID=182136 RepID=A0ABS2ZDY7_9BACL|nr:hypothetical protein [Fictibacillus barbaricus]MBN3545537.1 hypothetical protein [Fictibacillus barbaricus]GGB54191.1 hypothetical protein GCM10007199_19900 [Fictibacillus barbaricus]